MSSSRDNVAISALMLIQEHLDDKVREQEILLPNGFPRSQPPGLRRSISIFGGETNRSAVMQEMNRILASAVETIRRVDNITAKNQEHNGICSPQRFLDAAYDIYCYTNRSSGDAIPQTKDQFEHLVHRHITTLLEKAETNELRVNVKPK